MAALRELAPIVDPDVDPATEAAVQVMLDEGWPVASVLQWAAITMQHTPHMLGLSVERRSN